MRAELNRRCDVLDCVESDGMADPVAAREESMTDLKDLCAWQSSADLQGGAVVVCVADR